MRLSTITLSSGIVTDNARSACTPAVRVPDQPHLFLRHRISPPEQSFPVRKHPASLASASPLSGQQ